MGNSTSVGVVGFAAALATISIWLLGYFHPDLMANAPPGIEAAITGLFSAIVGFFIPHKEGL